MIYKDMIVIEVGASLIWNANDKPLDFDIWEETNDEELWCIYMESGASYDQAWGDFTEEVYDDHYKKDTS